MRTTQRAEEAFALLDRLEADCRKAATRRRQASPLADGGELGARLPGELANWHDPLEQYEHFAGWVYASVRPIAQRIAGQPLVLARVVPERRRGKQPQGDESPNRADKRFAAAPTWVKRYSERLEPLAEHPLLELLHTPNEFMVAWSLMYVTVVSLELTGRAYWWLSSGEEAAVAPVPAHWVREQCDEGGSDRWQVRLPGRATSIGVPAGDLASFHYPDPSMPRGAISPLQTQARAVRADEAIQAAQDHAFRNGIHPSYALLAGDALALDGQKRRPVLQKEQRQQLIAAVRQMYRGVTRWNEPLILDGLIQDIKQISSTPAEMDFLSSGRMTKERITQGFGVNPVIMGELEGANRASALAAREHFCDFTVNPKIELLSQVMTRYVAPRFAAPGERLVLWIETCQADDPDRRRREEEHLLKAGALSVNELRARHGLPAVIGGDVAHLPAASQSVPMHAR